MLKPSIRHLVGVQGFRAALRVQFLLLDVRGLPLQHGLLLLGVRVSPLQHSLPPRLRVWEVNENQPSSYPMVI